MENGTKLRLLYIYQYLLENTDSNHPQSTVDLINMLKEKYGMKVSRNTICNDLILLRQSDLHIEYVESTQNKYYYNGHPFEVSELKILIDALSSAKFITEEISQALIAKLLSLTTADNARLLRRHVTVEGRVKSENRLGYYSVDVINTAIDLRRKIYFKYTDYDVNKQRYTLEHGYTLSPYDLIWDGNYYYVRGFCDERQAMRNFRVDRINEVPALLNEAAVIKPVDYNLPDYDKAVFRMFDTDKPIEVELLCNVNMMKYLIDNFGADFESEVIDENTFKARISVCTSTTFYRWVFGFKGSIKIVGPEPVRTEYQTMLKNALNDCIQGS